MSNAKRRPSVRYIGKWSEPNLRVLIVVLEDFPGGDTRVRRQVAALTAEGHAVIVLCAKAYSTDTKWEEAVVLRTLTSRRKAGSLKRRIFEYVSFTLESFIRVFWLAATFRPQILQVANMPDFLILAALPAKLLCRSRLVLDMHDLMPELYASKSKSRSIVQWIMRVQECVGVRLADVVMTVNGLCGRLLIARYPGLTPAIIQNAPDPKTFPKLLPKCSFAEEGVYRIGYHGTVARRFGVATLVQAVAILNGQGVNVSLDIWGGGSELKQVQLLAESLGLGVVATFHGQVPVDVLVGQLLSLDVSVVPYEADPYMAIAYSTKAFELAMMGIPMVVSDLAGIREQFSDSAATFFSPGDADSLAAALQLLRQNPKLALGRAVAAQTELSKFDWTAISKRYIESLDAES